MNQENLKYVLDSVAEASAKLCEFIRKNPHSPIHNTDLEAMIGYLERSTEALRVELGLGRDLS